MMRQWLEKCKWGLARWMQGRYGQDSLSLTLLVAALILTFLSSVIRAAYWLSYVSLILMGWSIFRVYSKNLEKRRAENEKWLKLTKPVREWYRMLRRRFADRKTHRYYRCPECGQYLRVPKGKGRIAITCRNCGARFERKS